MKSSLHKTLFLLWWIVLVQQTRADWLVSSQTAPTPNTILRYSDAGAFLGVFASGNGLADPLGMTFGPDGDLYAASGNSQQVFRFNGQSGAFLGAFSTGGRFDAPINLTFGPDGKLYVSTGYDKILRFNGTNGVLIDTFVSGGRLAYPRGIKFGPDHNLYVVNYNTAEVLRYNGSTGAFIDAFVSAGSGGIYTPSDLAFGPDGNLYVTGGAAAVGVFRYNGATGAFIDQFVAFPAGSYPFDMAFGPDQNLYIVAQGSIQGVFRFNGRTGASIDHFVGDHSGGLSNPFGIAFLPAVIPPTNHPPSIICAALSPSECGFAATTLVQVADMEGEALTVVSAVNGVAVETNQVPANPRAGPISTNLLFAKVLPLGTNALTFTVTDSASNTASCSTLAIVRDTTPPTIRVAFAQPRVLWPPNHQMVPVTVHLQATDSCSVPTWRIIGASSNESSDGRGDGRTAPDWIITDEHTVNLRAERSGQGQGRIYYISIQATDDSGNGSAPIMVPVVVPHSM